MTGEEISYNKVVLSDINTLTQIDSILIADNTGDSKRTNNTHTHSGFGEGTGAQMEPGSGSTIMGHVQHQ